MSAMRTRLLRLRIAVTVTAALLAGGCGGGVAGTDKAGGAGTPVVLRLAEASTDVRLTPAVEYFVNRVAQISGGNLRIDIAENWGNSIGDAQQQVVPADAEQQVVHAVADGTVALGWVGTRVFDTVGVTSFQALQAPMLIDSYALENAVIESDIPDRMLDGLKPLGVEGIAVLADGLRKPIATDKPLRRPEDWQGITFAALRSAGQAAAIRALGATQTDVIARQLDTGLADGSIQGFEKSLFIYRARSMAPLAPYVTANVNLWPQVDILLVNPGRLRGLSGKQREWLRQAGADAASHSTATANHDAELVSDLCASGARFFDASPGDLAALSTAVAPVYTDIERDPQSRVFIEQIEQLKKSTATEPALDIPPGCTGQAAATPTSVATHASTEFDGTYRWTVTKADAVAHGTPDDKTPAGLDNFPGAFTMTLKDGTWVLRGEQNQFYTGAYNIGDNQITFHWFANALVFTFSADSKGDLTLKPVPPMDSGDQFIWSTEVWTKVD